MNFGFIKVGAYSPSIKVCDVDFNVEGIIKGIKEADKLGVQVLAFPELSLTGYTAGDLFYSDVLLENALKGLSKIAYATNGVKMLVFVGLPVKHDGLIYNVTAGICNGRVLAFVPKCYLPNYSEFYEKRYFSPATEQTLQIKLHDANGEYLVPLYKDILFCDKDIANFKVGAEICEDLWTPTPPSLYHTVNGARVIVNLSASPESVGRPNARRSLVKSHSSKTVCAYVYANAGDGESTTDCVFSGHNLIAENGEILAENMPFEQKLLVGDIDLDYIDFERSKVFNHNLKHSKEYITVEFSANRELSKIDRAYNKTPFIVKGEEQFALNVQANGLKKRLEHTKANRLVIGLSGGLDSTLAIIACVNAVKIANRPLSDILAVTMPCYGTTERTLDNSVKLAKALGVPIKRIDISKAVTRHLKDIDHDLVKTDAAFENAQARERTQVLMDIANMENGLVVGTGDLSELALGWATYNGDHMSMYAVNASISKTLVRNLVEYYRDKSKGKLKAVLTDILDTPVSPELLPAKDGEIAQKTEDLVGPYILHDFFLYNLIKRGFTPKKLYAVAVKTFEDQFEEQTVLKWLKTFYRRFFNQQFKRSCMPDGVKVSEISLSPRGSYKMPSDAVSTLWLQELENL